MDYADRMSMKSKHAHTLHVLDKHSRKKKFDWRKSTKIEHEQNLFFEKM